MFCSFTPLKEHHDPNVQDQSNPYRDLYVLDADKKNLITFEPDHFYAIP